MVAPRFEKLAGQYPQSNFLKDIASSQSVRAMPTFMLFRDGRKLGEVVGADIGRVERLVATHAGASSGGFPATGGRVLGSGATVGGASSASSKAAGGSSVGGGGGLTPMQQQALLFVGIVLALVFLYYGQQK
ncbi:hypothetical protein HK405_003234 [Cladochytrium tenue]|nr:hypothetical protein HK405_003234 [Cladochytrium tenue]